MDPKEQAKDHLQQMDNEKKEDILENFDKFKGYLSKQVERGEKMGMDEEQLAKTAETVANHLSKHEEPKNREEYLLQQLWKAGDKDQQHALAHLLVNLVKKTA
ncbi:DUF3243 domain-containing protein [Aciduricibacillus chroicocephali]|uniref:DUF3243 domain-containing protein n=1 Tax=Aciduricibacillus chroicocephali TaxID=3054939 RepID=A0ABY9KSN4_9BACI|nr:DUF3243 domain-containing protein [Bacillaceae bacterium 44XB]